MSRFLFGSFAKKTNKKKNRKKPFLICTPADNIEGESAGLPGCGVCFELATLLKFVIRRSSREIEDGYSHKFSPTHYKKGGARSSRRFMMMTRRGRAHLLQTLQGRRVGDAVEVNGFCSCTAPMLIHTRPLIDPIVLFRLSVVAGRFLGTRSVHNSENRARGMTRKGFTVCPQYTS